MIPIDFHYFGIFVRISLNTITLQIETTFRIIEPTKPGEIRRIIPTVYTSQGVPISVTGIAQVKVQGQNKEMLMVCNPSTTLSNKSLLIKTFQTACEQFLGKSESEIQKIALETLEGHQRAIMGSMTVEEIYRDRKKFSQHVFDVASSDLVNMGITVVSYTLKDIEDIRDKKIPNDQEDPNVSCEGADSRFFAIIFAF